MNIGARAAVASLVALACSGAAAHAEGPWYMFGGAGVQQQESLGGPDTFVNNATHVKSSGTQRISYDPGWKLTLGGGYRLSAHFRLQMEVSYSEFTYDKVNPVSPVFTALNGTDFTVRSGGPVENYAAAIGGFYDLPLEARAVPYLGGGFGAVRSHADATVFKNAAGTTFTEPSTLVWRGLWFLEGGIDIALDEHWAAVPSYRYTHTFFNSTVLGQPVNHLFQIAARYSF